jgi:hypothetical protein
MLANVVCIIQWLNARCKLAHTSSLVGMCADVSCKYHHVNTSARDEKRHWKVWQVELWSMLWLALCDLHECIFVSGLTWANLHSLRVILTILTVACTLINLGSGSGLCSSPTSLLPNPRNLRTTHQCLPFTPSAPPIFLIWPRYYGCNNTYHLGTLSLLYIPKHFVISLLFLKQCGQITAIVLSKNITFTIFSQKWSFWKCWSGPRILNDCWRKMTLRRTAHRNIFCCTELTCITAK